MKRTISIFLTILFLYNTVGFLGVHSFLSYQYKEHGTRDAEEFADSDEIRILVFKKSDIQNSKVDFRWIQYHEFKYNGELYDIVKKEEDENQLILYCISDLYETNLEEDFERDIENNTTNKKQNSGDNSPFKTLNSEAVSEANYNLSDVKGFTYSFYYIKNYIPICSETPCPPPKVS